MPSRRLSVLPSNATFRTLPCRFPEACAGGADTSPGRPQRRRPVSSSVAVALCLAVCVLAGCVQAPPRKPAPPPAPPAPRVELPPPPAPPAPPRVSDAERLLNYYDYALNLPPDELALEQERTSRFFGQHRSEFALMQLVLLRCLPGASAKDRAQAQEMLSSHLKESQDGSPELRALGLMLRTLLSDNQQLEAQLQAQGQKLRDEARRGDELKQKLDALVETERKLLERSKPQRNE
jgi:hypothetical protein